MATKRREATVRLAELLELELEPGEGTIELMERCIAEVEGQRSERHDHAMANAEQESEPRGAEPESSEGFQLRSPAPKRRRRRAA